jgi:hypothetical protein
MRFTGREPLNDYQRKSDAVPIFLWRPLQPVGEIDTMQPALVYEVPRKSCVGAAV